MRGCLIVILASMLAGCGSHLTGWNLGASVGQTDYQDGNRSLYTGAKVDAHFDVK